jgi:hypothetical protein
MIAVPLSKIRRFCDLFSARFEQNSGEHRYLATLPLKKFLISSQSGFAKQSFYSLVLACAYAIKFVIEKYNG